ncbi:hydantoinase/oxoprolinase family protein [Urbifossiella limnaea]|uniref:Hydantoinase/oxoprolinase n=1 Tax=Urbifossiella limnaea TaxID=2528023 RepID=A0A517XRX8_9BACT|nr:hydantoinase/oxoprolinase family protein [Urbifossiella limnaea]QDU20265.1 Hydantoinase/oxoprolinase [Urbifossiella limnaea]
MGTAGILGLDIGGANLKAATADGRAASVPFALWKQPDRLPAALAELVAQFPDAAELAVTMTGELCDCFETKRQGVNAILDATEHAAAGRPVRVWGTDGAFHTISESRANHLTVAAANWHALATFAGRFAPYHGGILIDIGSTTSDLIPLDSGLPSTYGLTDWTRLQVRELVYAGVRRTPVFAVYPDRVCAELFATTADVYVVLGLLPENEHDTDTANGRPLTVEHALTRLAHVLGADREELGDDHLIHFATRVHDRLRGQLADAARGVYYDQQQAPELRTAIVSGTGEFLARQVIDRVFGGAPIERTVSLNDELGPTVSACAPAYAVAVLAAEGRA